VQIRSHLRFLTITGFCGLAIFACVAFAALWRIEVNGPVYQRISLSKDLVADYVPPSESLLNVALNCSMMNETSDPTELHHYVSLFQASEKDFEQQHADYMRRVPEGKLKDLMRGTAYETAEQYFQVAQKELIPLVMQGEHEKAQRVLVSTMNPIYQKHAAAVDRIVDVASEEARQGEMQAANIVHFYTEVMVAVGLLILIAGGALSFAISRGISKQTDELQRSFEALQRSGARIRRLLESNIIGIGISDLNGRLLDANSAFLKIVGYTQEDLLSGGLGWDKITPAEYRDLDLRALEQLRNSGIASPWEKEFVRKDNSRVSVLIGVATLAGEAGGIEAVSFIVDISERKQLEQQLRQAQKMEAVGQLAGGIAHDFNNLLGVIIGYSDLLLDRLAPDQQPHRDVSQIIKACDHAASLTRQLLAFSRKQILQPIVLDLNAILADMEKLLRRLIGEDVELRVVPGQGPCQVKADPGQLEQVIMNLAVNARDAMPKGGKLTIETNTAELDGEYARQHPPAQPGRYMMLAMSDSGCGMNAETQARIFEPFFTTKELGKGTGLGLATVYGIVKQNGGCIWVYSEPGQGTTFKIYLPSANDLAKTERQSNDGSADCAGSETILVVEDDADLRELTRRCLEKIGYTALQAENPKDGIKIAEQYEGPIHLLVTDVIMPGMSGPELAAHLATLRPEMPVLYVSGYTDDAIFRYKVLEPGVAFLQKPFSLKTLARKVREKLDSVGARC